MEQDNMDDLAANAEGDEETEIGLPGSDTDEGIEGVGDDQAPETYLRDLTEDDVYNRLSSVNDFPSQLTAMESRFNGGVGDLSSRVAGLEKASPTQVNFDMEKLTKGLEAYDPKLAEVLGPLLQDVLKVNALDETTLRPYLDDMQGQMQNWSGEQLVMSAYSPETLAEIIPPVKDGRFVEEGQRHKDFTNWYTQQGYKTQQALLNFGAPYVNALRSFERWEQKQNKGRAGQSKDKASRLANGQVPTSQHRKTPQQKRISDDEAFEAGFNEAFKEVSN